MWTTQAELAWLTEQVPAYREAQSAPGQQIQTWLRGLATDFQTKFPAHAKQSHKGVVKRLRNWFSYHSDKCEPHTDARSPAPSSSLRLSIIRKHKKPIPLAPWQAYSKVYFTKGSALKARVHADFDALKAGDPTVAAKYSHLLPESVRQSPSSVVWLSFHRAVMADLVNNASEEELEAITEFTQARLGNDVRSFEQPWDAFSGGEDGSEVIKKRNYLESHVKALPDSIEAAFQDVEDITNFRMFSFVGGPSPGGGSLSVMNVQTGCSRNPAPGSNGSFESFLGDLYSDLKHKWVQWLATTYTEDEFNRTDLYGESSREPSRESVVPETPEPATDPHPEPTVDTDQSEPLTPPPTQQPPPRYARGRQARVIQAATQTATLPSAQQPARSSPFPMPSTPGLPPQETRPNPLSSLVSRPRPKEKFAYVSITSSGKTRPATSSDAPPDTSSPRNNNGLPRHTLVLDESCPTFLLSAEEFFLSVPGNDDWEELLSRYVEFEKLSPQTRGGLSTFSRPDQVGWWFRVGRRDFEKIPTITSLSTYEKLWIGWWNALQPDWRRVQGWPHPRDPPADNPWDKLLVGGKDGLFIVTMTLAWWIIKDAEGGSERDDSELEEAIADVSWVLSNLVSVLSAGDPEQISLPSSSQDLPPPSKRKPHPRSPSIPLSASKRSRHQSRHGMKVGPPKKRPRLP